MIGEYYPLWFDLFRLSILPIAFLISIGIIIYKWCYGLYVYNLDISSQLQIILLQKRRKK